MMWILFLIIIIFILKIKELNLHIDWKSFFRKGFKKLDNKFGIFCYTGKQGTGKTYSAIRFTLQEQEKDGYLVLTNIKSFHNSCPNSKYYSNIQDIIDFCEKEFKKPEERRQKVLIFFDEIFTCLEKGGSLKKEILSFLSQLRKRKIIFVTTAQEWSEIQITFRRYVRYQISCNMIALPFNKEALVINNINDGDLIRWDNDQQDFVAPLIQKNIHKGNQSIIMKYDTFETINISQGLNKTR